MEHNETWRNKEFKHTMLGIKVTNMVNIYYIRSFNNQQNNSHHSTYYDKSLTPIIISSTIITKEPSICEVIMTGPPTMVIISLRFYYKYVTDQLIMTGALQSS